jgi:alpha-amylase
MKNGQSYSTVSYGILYQLLEHKNTSENKTMTKTPFVWKGVYFLMTDRFNNGDPSNDLNFGRDKKTENFVVLKVVISKEFQKKLMRDILINWE